MNNNINIYYNWPKDVWWSHKEIDDLEPDAKINRIINYSNILKNFKSEPNSNVILKGYADDFLKLYVRELMIGESICSDKNEDIESQINFIENMICNPNEKRMNKKAKNIYNVVTEIFNDPFIPNLSIENFNFKLIMKIHEIIMKDLLEDNGKVRRTEAKAIGENWNYLDSEKIVDELQNLLMKTVTFAKNIDQINDLHEKLEKMVKLGAQFLVRFLYIHPFANGNGRVGRILLSYLLSNVSGVPVSLYLKNIGRNVYLGCLRQAQENHYVNTESLAMFILNSIYKNLVDVTYALELETDFKQLLVCL